MPNKTNWGQIERDARNKAHAAEIAALKQQLDHAVSQIERLEKSRRAKIIAATPPRKRDAGDVIRVVIPDTHGAKASRPALAAMLSDISALNPNEIVMLGDHVDCGGHLAEHHVMGYVAETAYSYEDDIAAANAFMDSLRAAAPSAKIEYIEGNHECLTADHDVLTRRGWKPVADVTKEDEVATLGPSGRTEWQRPTETIRRKHSGDMIVSNTNSFYSTSMTPGHRVAYYGQYMGDLRYRLASEVVKHRGSSIDLPVAGLGRTNDYADVSDDHLRLLGWILTDGCITGGIRIYQSKPDGVAEVQALLERMGVPYTFHTRKPRKISPIGGVAVKTSLPQGVFYITAEGRGAALHALGLSHWHHSDRAKKSIPDYVWQLSERQFDVLMDAIARGDGHRTSKKSASIYGSLEFLEPLQALCVANGYRALLRSKTRQGRHSHWVLYTVKCRAVRVPVRCIETTTADCEVFCLVTPNTNFFVRRNGSVHVTGNCRVETWCITATLRHGKDAEGLRRLYAPEFRLFLAQRGIPYYRRGEFYDGLPIPGVIRRGKCYFFHGFNTSKAATAKTLEQIAGNCVFAHTHRAQSDVQRKIGSGVIGAWNPGCLCELQPLWQHTHPTTWTHGFGIQVQSDDGDFLHINIPIIEGKSLFSSLVRL